MNKILISRTDGIGDLLLTTPLIRELKLKYPSAHISALVSGYAAPLLENNPNVNEVIIYDEKSKPELIKKLKNDKYDAVIAVYPRPALAWIFFLAGIPKRFGTASRWYSFLYNNGVKISRKSSEKHEAMYNMMLADSLIGEKEPVKADYFTTPEEIKKAKAYVRSKKLKKFVTVYPGGNGSAANLPPAKYTEIINSFIEKSGMNVLIASGKWEQGLCEEVYAGVKEKSGVAVMTELLTIRELAAVISLSEAFLSGSTGPMHIAAALGVKTLALFPLSGVVPSRWGPLGNEVLILRPGQGSHMDDMNTQEIAEKLNEFTAGQK